ncbi:HAD hydrolase-like protein [Acholeplasma vituli]|uniref:HAD hydrolase-like protein n=1 Tax=Paracholeplasma vituli TaxID=69473 RepID=A0ABT2PTU4_9MOLU|nr:HAD hydrolase-like protein [Paracholeplasma vituli]MCU0104361.1 HAD hydrolase-like protein [Paracholeplasma vituli]
MIKYLIWDFNGTILDDLVLCLDLLNDMLEQQNKPRIDIPAYKNIFGFPIKDYYIEAGLSFDTVSFDVLSQYFIQKYQPSSFQCRIHEGVIDVLKMTRNMGVKNIILSASETNNLLEQVKVLGIETYFEHIVGTDNIKGQGKVARGIQLMNDTGIDPKQCLYIGDTIHDAEVAEALGIKVILYSGGHQSKERLKSTNAIIIDHLSDIMGYIEVI